MVFSEEPPTRQETLRELAKLWNQRHHFYGKVVDLDGNPLEDVKIETSTDSATMFGTFKTKKKILFTDKDGTFEVHFTGSSISIRSVQKEFYEFSRHVNKHTDISYISNKHLETSKDNPLVLRLRRRSVPAYLIKEEIGLLAFGRDRESISGIPLFYDYSDNEGHRRVIEKKRPLNNIRQQVIESRLPSEVQKKAIMQNDILIETWPIGDSGEYEFKFTVLNDNSELIMTDQLLYEAPEDGYSSAANIIIASYERFSKDFKRYLYARSKDGRFYSRVNIRFAPASSRVTLDIYIYTNPASSRNLEYDSKYQIEERKRRSEIGKKRRKAKEAAKKKTIEFDEEKFMNNIRAEEAEARKNKPLKWWNKLKIQEQEKKDKQDSVKL